MMALVDAQLVTDLNTITGISTSSMVYGRYESAKIYWVRTNNGRQVIPWLAFHREIDFHPEWKLTQSRRITQSTIPAARPLGAGNPATDPFLDVKWMPVTMRYTVDISTDTVVEQNDIMRAYFFWAGESPFFTIADATQGTTWQLGATFDAPVDASSLEEREESGRIVRTTLSFSVEGFAIEWTDVTSSDAEILAILADVHLYDGVNTAGIPYITSPDRGSPGDDHTIVLPDDIP